MIYKIEYQTEEKIIGKSYPQLECKTIFQAQMLNAWEFPPHNPKLEFNLAKNAILTDILSNVAIIANGLIISQKLKNILEEHKLINHKFYDLTVNSNTKSYKYYWFHICEPEIVKKIDYTKSEFYRTEFTFREEPIQLNSYNEYEEIKKNDTNASFGVEIDSLFITNEFDKTLDLFTFLPFDNSIYISEKLYNKILINQITGIEIVESPHIHII